MHNSGAKGYGVPLKLIHPALLVIPPQCQAAAPPPPMRGGDCTTQW